MARDARESKDDFPEGSDDPRLQAARRRYDSLQQSYAQMLGRLQALERSAVEGPERSGTASASQA